MWRNSQLVRARARRPYLRQVHRWWAAGCYALHKTLGRACKTYRELLDSGNLSSPRHEQHLHRWQMLTVGQSTKIHADGSHARQRHSRAPHPRIHGTGGKGPHALPQFERNHFAKVLEARAAEWRQCDAANPLPALWPIRIQVLGLLNTVRARSRRRRD